MLDVAFVQRRGSARTSNNVEACNEMTPPNSAIRSSSRSVPARLGLASWRGRLAWLAGLGVLVMVICWVLARHTPDWYVPLDPADDGVQRAALAAQTRATQDLHNALERLPLGEQRWSITQEEVNALLAVKTELRRSPITDPFVIFARGQITLCARVKQLPGADPQGGVGSLTFDVGMTSGAAGGEAMGLVKLTRVRVGDLPVPRSLVERQLRAQEPGMIQAIHQALELQIGGRDAGRVGPIIEQIIRSAGDERPFPLRYKGESRELIIRELRVEDGAFTLVLASVKPAATGTRAAPVP
jgi:hypothetical protein